MFFPFGGYCEIEWVMVRCAVCDIVCAMERVCVCICSEHENDKFKTASRSIVASVPLKLLLQTHVVVSNSFVHFSLSFFFFFFKVGFYVAL